MKKKIVLLLTAFIVGVAVLALYQNFLTPSGVKGEKTITLIIQDARAETVILNEATYKTDTLFLGEFIDELVEDNKMTVTLIGKKEDAFGRYIQAMMGIESDLAAQYYWGYTSDNNKECVKAGYCIGIDQLPIEDGDHFVFSIGS